MNDEADAGPTGDLLYHATGKFTRYLARFAGEDPDAVEHAYHDTMGAVTAGADPVLIGEAMDDGITLGLSLAERRRALRQYHTEVVRKELAPPAYDTDPIVADGEVIGVRVLVSEPACEFYTASTETGGAVLARTPEASIEIPLEFTPGEIEPVEAGDSVSEAIIHRTDTDGAGKDPDGDPGAVMEEYLEASDNDVTEDHDTTENGERTGTDEAPSAVDGAQSQPDTIDGGVVTDT